MHFERFDPCASNTAVPCGIFQTFQSFSSGLLTVSQTFLSLPSGLLRASYVLDAEILSDSFADYCYSNTPFLFERFAPCASNIIKYPSPFGAVRTLFLKYPGFFRAVCSLFLKYSSLFRVVCSLCPKYCSPLLAVYSLFLKYSSPLRSRIPQSFSSGLFIIVSQISQSFWSGLLPVSQKL